MIASHEKKRNSFYSVTEVIIQMGGLIIGQVVGNTLFFLFFGTGANDFDKWAKALIVVLVFFEFAYAFYKLKKQYLKVFSFSILNSALLFSELYFYTEVLKGDISFGFMIIVLAGILIPLNHILLNLMYKTVYKRQKN